MNLHDCLSHSLPTTVVPSYILRSSADTWYDAASEAPYKCCCSSLLLPVCDIQIFSMFISSSVTQAVYVLHVTSKLESKPKSAVCLSCHWIISACLSSVLHVHLNSLRCSHTLVWQTKKNEKSLLVWPLSLSAKPLIQASLREHGSGNEVTCYYCHISSVLSWHGSSSPQWWPFFYVTQSHIF